VTAAAHSAPEEARGPAVRVACVRAGYGQGDVVRDVSLEVQRGSVTALLGPNGAGKSTLLKVVAGVLAPSSGRVELAGSDVSQKPAHLRARSGLCYLPEGRGIYRSLSVADNLRMQSPRGSDSAAIDRATEAFPILAGRLRQVAGTMSGGEQQMLALAAAYVRDPQVLMVDEPSLGLAPIVVDVVFEFLDRLRGEGRALLIVDQYAHRVLELATWAYVLRRGEIAYAGPAAALRDGDVFKHYLGSTVE
jgi:branched-chain amino acid transport system ATP-binding protein